MCGLQKPFAEFSDPFEVLQRSGRRFPVSYEEELRFVSGQGDADVGQGERDADGILNLAHVRSYSTMEITIVYSS